MEKIPSDTNGNVSPDRPIEPEYKKCKYEKEQHPKQLTSNFVLLSAV